MHAQAKNIGTSALAPWLQYQEMVFDYWNTLVMDWNHPAQEEKPTRSKITSKEKPHKRTDEQSMTAYLYQYDEFMKYWNFQNGLSPQHVPVPADDTALSGHGDSEEQSSSPAKPYELWNEYYLSLLRGVDRYLALWRSASETLFSIRALIPEERYSFLPAPLKTFQNKWQDIISGLMMPVARPLNPMTALFEHYPWISGIMRPWVNNLGSTATTTWMSLLKKEIDHLTYETGLMKKSLNQLQNHNFFSPDKESSMNEVIRLQKESVARTMGLISELTILKTAVHDLRTALRKQKKIAYHALKEEMNQPQPHI